MADKDYYKILNLIKADNPTADQIKKAFTMAELQAHPDKVRNKARKANADITAAELEKLVAAAAPALQEAREAYKVLGDEKLRNIYDTQGYDAVVRAQSGGSVGSPVPTSTGPIHQNPVKLVQNPEEAMDFFQKNARGSHASTQSSGAASSTPAVRHGGPNGGHDRRANRQPGGGPSSGNYVPASAQPPVSTPPPAAAPVSRPAASQQPANPVQDLADKADQLKDAFGKAVSVPLDSLEQIREKLEGALEIVKAQIAKAKPPSGPKT